MLCLSKLDWLKPWIVWKHKTQHFLLSAGANLIPLDAQTEVFLLEYQALYPAVLGAEGRNQNIWKLILKKVLIRTPQPQGPIDYPLSLKTLETLGKLGESFGGLPGRRHSKKTTLISRNQVNGQEPGMLYKVVETSGWVGQLKRFSLRRKILVHGWSQISRWTNMFWKICIWVVT